MLPKTGKKAVSKIEEKIIEMCRMISKEQFHFILSLGIATKIDSETDFNDTVIDARDIMQKNKLNLC